MHCSLRLLLLRRPHTTLRPEYAPFSRHASLTSAISRGIRRTQGGFDSFERRTSSRPSRETGQESDRQSSWRTGDGYQEGAAQPERSPTYRGRDIERNGDRFGRSQGSSKWQANSDNSRRNDRGQGSSFSQRRTGRDEYEPRRTPRSSPFDRNDFKNTGDAGSRYTRRSQESDGPNRRERRAAKFGEKTWSDSREGGRRVYQTEDTIRPRYGRESMEPFEAEKIEDHGRGGSGGLRAHDSLRSDRSRQDFRSGASSRPSNSYESSQNYGNSDRRRRERNDDREEGHTYVRKGTVQPYTKVPLSIPYTTAGSEFLYGTHVVKAALQSGRRKLYKLYIYQGTNAEGEEAQQDNAMYKIALAAGVVVSKVGGEWAGLLSKMSDQRPHNGFVLETSPVPKLPVTALEKVESPSETFSVQLDHQSAEELAINGAFEMHGPLASLPATAGAQRYPFVVMLDRIKDPGNLGSILRTAYFLGAEAVVLIEHGTAPVGPVALKSSASAAEYLPLLRVKNEHAFMRKSQESGWKFFGATSADSTSATAGGTKPLSKTGITTALQEGPCVLLLGSEGEGIRPQLQRIVNGTVGIECGRSSAPGLDSLNVGVAGALLMQEFLQGSKHAASEAEVQSGEGVQAAAESEAPLDESVLQEEPEKAFAF